MAIFVVFSMRHGLSMVQRVRARVCIAHVSCFQSRLRSLWLNRIPRTGTRAHTGNYFRPDSELRSRSLNYNVLYILASYIYIAEIDERSSMRARAARREVFIKVKGRQIKLSY